MQWDSHHSLSTKYSVISILTCRENTVCTGPELLQRELQYLRKALIRCKYPHWAIHRVHSKFLNSNWEDSSNNNLQDTSNNSTSSTDQPPQPGATTTIHKLPAIQTQAQQQQTFQDPNPPLDMLSYHTYKGWWKVFKNTCMSYKLTSKENTTIKQVLMKPRDQDPKDKKSGVIYSFQCNHIACNDEYIGETSRTLHERYKNASQATLSHACTHTTNRTQHYRHQIQHHRQGGPGLARAIKESIYIRVNNPTLNCNIGKYNFSHIWNRVLFNNPGLKLGSSQQPSHTNIIRVNV